jgi:single-strand DNA-binding protein
VSVNKAILVGHLGADPETKTASSGLAIASLRVATSERVKDGDSWKDHTEWHRVVCFGKTAENVGKYLTKGRQVYVEGRIRTQKWTDKEGRDRYTTEIVADQVHFLGGGKGNGDREAQPNTGSTSGQQTQGGGDDDIPF